MQYFVGLAIVFFIVFAIFVLLWSRFRRDSRPIRRLLKKFQHNNDISSNRSRRRHGDDDHKNDSMKGIQFNEASLSQNLQAARHVH
jgi:hypothetical protein